MPKVTQIGNIRLWIQAHMCVSLKTEFSQFINILFVLIYKLKKLSTS